VIAPVDDVIFLYPFSHSSHFPGPLDAQVLQFCVHAVQLLYGVAMTPNGGAKVAKQDMQVDPSVHVAQPDAQALHVPSVAT
jgi:hypothetical protein